MSTTQIAYIVPASKRAEANAALDAAGMGPNNFSVPMTLKTGGPSEPPPPFWACCGWVNEDRAAIFAAVIQSIPGAKAVEELPGQHAFKRLMDQEGVKRMEAREGV